MLIIGCDFHTRYQQIAMAREETGELLAEQRLDHESGEAHAFYRSLQSSQEAVRVGIEATGPIQRMGNFLTYFTVPAESDTMLSLSIQTTYN